MKGVLVFNQLNDVVFVHCDSSFRKHVNKQAVEAGLISAEEVEGPIDHNVVVQLFLPLITSQRYMLEQRSDPYEVIELEDDTMYMFEQMQDHLFVAVCGDKNEKESFLHRKLLVLQRIITLLVGPILEQVRPSKLHERKQRWKMISYLLDTWYNLCEEEQCFLMEAVERLYVNHMLNAKGVEILERVMSEMRNAGEKKCCPCHAFDRLQVACFILQSTCI